MRISDALALGRYLIKPLAGIRLSSDGTQGCAWGMIETAAPSTYGKLLNRGIITSAILPCDCATPLIIGNGMLRESRSMFCNLSQIIVHLFNYHVMTRHDWTMDQLIDWVRSVEPPDPEEKVTETAKSEEEVLV